MFLFSYLSAMNIKIISRASGCWVYYAHLIKPLKPKLNTRYYFLRISSFYTQLDTDILPRASSPHTTLTFTQWIKLNLATPLSFQAGKVVILCVF
jgi:hypothetical protein